MAGSQRTTAELMGRVGLPAPISELARRRWDAIVVGAGHNGLTTAAYLSRAGLAVLVLERREQLGGACTLERPFPDPGYVISPCAYAVGLLDHRVIDELGLRARGYRVFPVDPHLWSGFADGSSYAEYVAPDRTRAHLLENGFPASEIDGLDRYYDLYARARRRLREGPDGDLWAQPSPSRERIEEILDDPELVGLVFEDSIAELLERHLSDPRLHRALWGQGVIGTWAGPRTPGTAMVKLMHSMGTLEGEDGAWGYVEGGMGRVSFAIADAAREAGAVIAAGVPVARIHPGECVELESGEVLRAGAVICNADPKRLLGMLEGTQVPADYAARLEAWDVGSPVVKLNAALGRRPRWSAASGDVAPERAMVTVAAGLDEGQAACEASRNGEVRVGFCEIYFQTAYDPSVAPAGKQTMSVFAQYAPYELATGGWESRREQIGDAILEAIAGSAPDIHDCIEFREVLGPPDIEGRIGLSGGHIFQGSALPQQMWDRRLEHRSPIPGLFLCGAATHPGGSVIGLNGRNAALALLGEAASRSEEPRSRAARSYPAPGMTPETEIEGIGEELQAAGKGSRWEQFRMPVELSGKSFLDVGCWEGMHCAEAVRRDASQVVGIDLCTSDDLATNVERYGFDFLQMDIFSEKWLELGEYDVVLCSGVLYHVENVMSLLFRLRKVTRELIVIETGITRLQEDKPMMIYHGQGEGTNNPSNWWTPNKLCLEQMLNTAGFEGVSTVWEEERHEHYSRICVQAVPTGHLEQARILPRKERTMSLHGGNRKGGKGKKNKKNAE